MSLQAFSKTLARLYGSPVDGRVLTSKVIDGHRLWRVLVLHRE